MPNQFQVKLKLKFQTLLIRGRIEMKILIEIQTLYHCFANALKDWNLYPQLIKHNYKMCMMNPMSSPEQRQETQLKLCVCH